MKTILVTGDIVVDHHIYEGQRFTASALDQRGAKVCRKEGGAIGLNDLIEAVSERANADWNAEKSERERVLDQKEKAHRKIKSSDEDPQRVKIAAQEVNEAKERLSPPPEAEWASRFGLTRSSEGVKVP